MALENNIFLLQTYTKMKKIYFKYFSTLALDTMRTRQTEFVKLQTCQTNELVKL